MNRKTILVYISYFILTIILGIIPSEIKSQPNRDSLLLLLRDIKGIQDAENSASIDKAYFFIYRYPIDEITIDDNAIWAQLVRLENHKNFDAYISLTILFLEKYLEVKDDNVQKFLIDKGTDLINKYDNIQFERYKIQIISFLREMRKPYRNGRYIYDGIEYFGKKVNQYEQQKDSLGLSVAYNVLSGFYNRLGLIDRSEYYMLKSIDNIDMNIVDDRSNTAGLLAYLNRYSVLGSYFIESDKEKAYKYLNMAISNLHRLKKNMEFSDRSYLYLQYAKLQSIQGKDSADHYFEIAQRYDRKIKDEPGIYAFHIMELGVHYLRRGNLDSASFYLTSTKNLKDSLKLSISSFMGELIPNYYLGKLALMQKKPYQTIQLLIPEIKELRKINARKLIIKELLLLAEAYQLSDKLKESNEIYKEILEINNTLKKDEDKARFLSYESEKKMEADLKKIDELEWKNKSASKTQNLLFGITTLLVLLAITLITAFFFKQRSNYALNKVNQDLNKALTNLKQTQTQLIQSEKMASLGELTAGIAHEIQNPLNFVNNFSEVSNELIDEMIMELKKGKYEDVTQIANDVKQNLEKINHHGKRADAIVKGMLQHSRKSTGQKEATDINALCDEYLRLSYHGLRAKDKSFNADFELLADDNLPKINVISQDIGRVLLNIINNAFYACAKKAEESSSTSHEESTSKHHYKPKVSVKTESKDDTMEIIIHDNGIGMPQNIIDKIFQPFFTTKPTGQGTGLGLSLSYDIVKAHGGELKVESIEGKGSDFIITLPSKINVK